MRDIRDSGDALEKAGRLIAAFQKKYVRNNFSDEEKMNCRLYNVNHCDCPIGYSCSIGISFYNLDGSNFYELYHAADAALYKAKESGRNRYVCFQKPDQHQPSQSIVLLPPNGEALEN
jgi:GGDEF domain-containing protein